MTCHHIPIAGGIAIVCTRGEPRPKPCRACGRPATKACDWKLKGKQKNRTCSAPLCAPCATNVGPGKDLCPAHARAWETHPANPKNKRDSAPDDGESAAQEALNLMHEEATGRRPGLLDMLDVDSTSFEDVMGYTPGDQ